MKELTICQKDIYLFGYHVQAGMVYGKFQNKIYYVLESPELCGGILTAQIYNLKRDRWERMDLSGKFSDLNRYLISKIDKFWDRMKWASNPINSRDCSFKNAHAEQQRKAAIQDGAKIGAPSSEVTRKLDPIFQGSPKSAALSTGRYNVDNDFWDKHPNVTAGTGIHVSRIHGKKVDESPLAKDTKRKMEQIFAMEKKNPYKD